MWWREYTDDYDIMIAEILAVVIFFFIGFLVGKFDEMPNSKCEIDADCGCSNNKCKAKEKQSEQGVTTTTISENTSSKPSSVDLTKSTIPVVDITSVTAIPSGSTDNNTNNAVPNAQSIGVAAQNTPISGSEGFSVYPRQYDIDMSGYGSRLSFSEL